MGLDVAECYWDLMPTLESCWRGALLDVPEVPTAPEGAVAEKYSSICRLGLCPYNVPAASFKAS